MRIFDQAILGFSNVPVRFCVRRGSIIANITLRDQTGRGSDRHKMGDQNYATLTIKPPSYIGLKVSMLVPSD